MNRTEDQKLFQEPAKAILRGKECELRPLKLREEREWRKEFSDVMGVLPKYANVTTDDPDAFQGAVAALMITLPDQVVDLFFHYAKDLDRDKLEEEVTGAEVAEAFKVVITMAFPLPQVLTEAMTKLSQ